MNVFLIIKKSNIFFIYLSSILICDRSFSQQLNICSGNSISCSEYSIDYSIGEITVIQVQNIENIITSGVIQPDPKIITPSAVITNDLLTVFPNPTKKYFSVVGRYNWIDSYIIYSLSGIKLLAGAYNNNQINISSLPPGVYLVKVFSHDTSSYKTIKIIRQ